MELIFDLAVLASEEFVPPDDWRAQIAVPTGILFLLGGVFMLLRSNLGTRRAYFVQASSFFGFMLMISLFWALGAPGTPPFQGPQNLPGQPLDYYQEKWVPFAQDSLIAEEPEYADVQGYPETFQDVPAEVDEDFVEDGVEDVQAFFAGDEAGGQVGEDWIPTDVQYAVADNNRPMVAVQFTEPQEDAPLEPDPDGESYVAFGFFEEGNLIFPSLVFVVLSLVGFILHLVLLAWDERQERRDLEEDLTRRTEEERVPTPA